MAFLGLVTMALSQFLLIHWSGLKSYNRSSVHVMILIFSLLFASFLFYPHFKNITKTSPQAWTKKESPVFEQDIIVLRRASEFLNEENNWDKNKDRHCLIWEKKSLFCAIALAQKEINGVYIHGSTSIQQVRYIIDEIYEDRWSVHPIMEFNNHSETSFADVENTLRLAIQRIEARLNNELTQ